MTIRMFGHRCLVEHYRPKSSSLTGSTSIVIPDVAKESQNGTHRFGKVVSVGDGLNRKTGQTTPPLVKKGDIVLFQINQVMEHTQTYSVGGKAYMNLLQTELIAKLKDGDDLSFNNLEMLGDYVMLKHFMRETGSKLVLPDNVSKQSQPEFIYFKLVAKGNGVDKEIALDQEVIANHGRLTPIFFVKRNLDGSITNEEYCYTIQDWLDGAVS